MPKLTAREILVRELKKLLSKETLIYFAGVPLLAMLVFGFLYVKRIGREYPIIVADLEQNAASRLAVFYLDSSPELRVASVLPSLDEALREMKNSKAAAVVLLPKNIYKNVLHKKSQPAYVYVDSRNIVAANSLYMGIAKTLGTARIGAQLKLMDKYFPTPDRMEKILPLRIISRSIGNPSVDYFLFVLSAILMLSIQQGLLVGSCVGIAHENETGAIARLITEYGGGIRYYFFRHLAVLSFNIPLILIVVIAFHAVFSVPSANLPLSLLLTLLYSASVITFSQVVGSFFRTRLMALQVLFFYTLPVFFISGYTFPSENIHPALRIFSAFLPTTPVLNAFPRINYIEGAATYMGGFFLHQAGLYLLYLALSFIIPPLRRKFAKPVSQQDADEFTEQE